MHPDVEALRKLQDEDLTIDALEDRFAGLEPRLLALDRARRAAEGEVAKARDAVAAEERSQTMLRGRIEQHRELHSRNAAQMDHISRARETAAAMAQLDQAKRMIADDEEEIRATGDRLNGLRERLAEKEMALALAQEEEQTARRTLGDERAAIERELAEARTARGRTAERVPAAIRQRYERIRSRRREQVVYPVRNNSCAHCDTMIPVQRRSAMIAKGSFDVCEGCGVLLFAE